MTEKRKAVTFDCGHVWYFKTPYPTKGQLLWCMKCRKERVVLNGMDDWTIRCTGCVYSRTYGAAKVNAEIAIGKHRRKNPSHIMKLFNGKICERIFNGGVQTVTESDDGVLF